MGGFSVGADRLAVCDVAMAASRVGLLSHQPAVCRDGRNSAQLLHAAVGERLVRIFGPEHGYFCAGGPGEHVASSAHPEWGIPVVSLYGERRRPPVDLVQDLDCVVVDLQDIGARCYTYLATLRKMLEVCAETGVPVVVCDRPIPLPCVTDGPMLDPGYESFVAGAAVSMFHGMTPGESARWLVAAGGLDVDLTVLAMGGYGRDAGRGAGWPEWIPPSPGIRTWESAECYLATVFTEGLTMVDCGRDTGLAFRLVGAAAVRSEELLELLNAQQLPGVVFAHHRYDSCHGPNAGSTLDGVRISVRSRSQFRPVTTSVAIIWALSRLRADPLWNAPEARAEFFDKLYGTSRVRTELASGAHWRDVVAPWAAECAPFAQSRRGALLYPEDQSDDA